MRRYFVHQESTSAWFEDNDAMSYEDPSVEEVSYDEFLQACAAWGEDPDGPRWPAA